MLKFIYLLFIPIQSKDSEIAAQMKARINEKYKLDTLTPSNQAGLKVFTGNFFVV